MTWDDLLKAIAVIKQDKRDGKITQDECDERCAELMSQYADKNKKAKA